MGQLQRKAIIRLSRASRGAGVPPAGTMGTPFGGPGFTLAEVLLAAGISVLVLLATYMVYDNAQSTYTRTERRSEIQQNARAALETMARQIRMAGYAAFNNPAPVANPVVIGTPNVLVIRGDVRLNNPALPFPGVDTIFGLSGASGLCPASVAPCLMTQMPEAAGGTNV